jgi:pyruvate kinase
MRRSRKVKILATLGPASSDEAMIRKLFEAGADVFRINMSHTDHDLMRTLVGRIRAVEAAVGRPIGILADLQGPKLRVGKFAERQGRPVRRPDLHLDDDPTPGDATRVHLPHPEILTSVEPGDRLLIDDGKLELVGGRDDGRAIVCTVVSGDEDIRQEGRQPAGYGPAGRRPDRKGPRDLDAVLDRRRLGGAVLHPAAGRPGRGAQDRARPGGDLMSKIEKPQAVARLAEIIELSDALMVARGDLGVEMPLEAVPGIQKQITRAARGPASRWSSPRRCWNR